MINLFSDQLLPASVAGRCRGSSLRGDLHPDLGLRLHLWGLGPDAGLSAEPRREEAVPGRDRRDGQMLARQLHPQH